MLAAAVVTLFGTIFTVGECNIVGVILFRTIAHNITGTTNKDQSLSRNDRGAGMFGHPFNYLKIIIHHTNGN